MTSSYYLCDTCNLKMDPDHLNTCVCVPWFPAEHRKKVMVDHNCKDGRRYDDPNDVCGPFEPMETCANEQT